MRTVVSVWPRVHCLCPLGRVHATCGDYYTALKTVENLDFRSPMSEQVRSILYHSCFDLLAGDAALNRPRNAGARVHEGYVLLAADYTQMEMKVLACAARDSGLLSLFQQQAETQGDVYKMMSGQIHQKPLDMVTPHERSAAKTIALGIIYGMGPEQTAARLSITFGAACAIIKKFHALFPGVSKFISATKSRARANGFVATVGRNRRYLPDITSTDAQKRATAERQSVNSIIQGSASEMIKLAMIEMGAEVSREDWTGAEPPELVASIHDELLYVVHEDDVPALVSLLKHVMEDSVPTQFGLQLRFSVDVQSGPSWGEMAPYKE